MGRFNEQIGFLHKPGSGQNRSLCWQAYVKIRTEVRSAHLGRTSDKTIGVDKMGE